VAPTLNVEELDKRITELKAVHFWLDQNGKALGATIQALEVQKMTLATLKGMNFNMGEVANALKARADNMMSAAQAATGKAAKPTEEEAEASPKKPAARAGAKSAAKAGNGVVDPMQWWGALTQQFQEIASTAMKDVAQKTAVDTARNMATGVAKEAVKAATGMAKVAAGGSTAAARKSPARKKKAR
jgi:hypothetical protein